MQPTHTISTNWKPACSMKSRFSPTNADDRNRIVGTRPLLALLFVCLLPLSQTHAAEKAGAPPASAPAPTQQEQPYDSVEERRLKEAMKAAGKPQLLNDREELERRQKELKRLEGEVDKKIEQLNQLRVQVEKLLEQKGAEEQNRVTELAKMYEKMTADKAAAVISNLETPLAISILGKMKTKSAAKILNTMERDKAAKLTTAFSTLSSP